MFQPRGLTGVLPAMLLAMAVQSAGGADVFDMPEGLTSLEFVTVGNPGNAADTRFVTPGYGKVDYTCQIGKYDVTAGQYCEFLNAVAKTDTYGLYHTSMDTAVDQFGCNIKRTGDPGGYSYSVAANWANRPVNFVNWGDAARFCNWLSNGQPTGLQGLVTTENGSYYLNGATSRVALMAVTRKSNAHYVLPSENEWYKAAYYDPDKPGGAGYWTFATRSDITPDNTFLQPDPGNHANFEDLHDFTIGYPYYRTEVVAFTNSSSAYDTFDQNGNVGQWNETAVTILVRGYRGGSFEHFGNEMQASSRNGGSPLDEIRSIGFRIANVPEPGSVLVLLTGAIGFLVWKRHSTFSAPFQG
jgi:formylglycine-generating enzyme